MADNNSKLCAKCGTVKSKSEFARHKNRADGVQVYCLSCMAEIRKQKQYDKTRWLERKEFEGNRSKAYREANKDRLLAYWRAKTAAARSNAPGKTKAWNIARRNGQAKATPLWANFSAINAIYREAKRLTAIDGIKRHIDHIIPLNGLIVSGLHVENNLQILTKIANQNKSNRFVCETTIFGYASS